MKASVILCTYNRCESLAKALESIALSAVPASIEWDVLVVDNNSQDQTRSVVEQFCKRYPGRFRYLYEPKQGKSNALNSGIREARADLLAFVDDDVEVDPNWLHNLAAVLRKKEWVGAGGRILPEASFKAPRWLDTRGRYALAPLAIFDLGLEAGELKEAPFGTNMIFRTEAFSRYGDFRTDLGPQPGSELRNEDSEFGSRLLRKGERFWYEPSAVVYHAVPQYRVRRAYFLTWWFDKGRADIRAFGTSPKVKWRVAGIPMYFFRRIFAWTLRWMGTLRTSQRFSCKVKVWRLAGAMLECYRLAHGAAPISDNDVVHS